MTEEAGEIGISTALDALREELEEAWLASEGRSVRFRVSEVTLTVQAVVRRETEGGVKLRWWLIEAGGEARAARESTQTLVLTLTPGLYEEGRESGPLDVHGEESVPAG